MSTTELNGGVSRHGRVRKKTAKLMEMEEIETAPTPGTDRPPVRPVLTTPQSRSAKKKTAKLRITIGGEEVLSDANDVMDEQYVTVLEPFECEEVVTEEVIDHIPEPPVVHKTVPSLKIKLNPVKGTAELEDRTNNHTLKRKGSAVNGSEASERKKGKKSPTVVAAATSSHSVPVNNHSEDHFSLNHTSHHSSDQLETGDVIVPPVDEAPAPVTPKVETKKKAVTSAKAGKGSKSTPGSTVKRTNVTAYTLWCKENRPKVQKSDPQMDFASASRALGEIWQSLSNNEKLQWKLKADKIKNGPVQMRETGPPAPEPPVARPNHAPVTTPASSRTSSAPQHLPVRRIVPSVKAAAASSSNVRVSKKVVAPEAITWQKTGKVTPIDVSSYLRILGESLSSIGRRLSEQKHLPADRKSLLPLMDATLCSFAPLIALTTLDPRMNGCHPSTHTQMLENLSFIMPDV